MQATPRSLLKIFHPEIQYEIPIFQRRYVWNEADQWAELWEDLVELVDDVERVKGLNANGGEVPLPSHFLGAIVCDQSHSVGQDIDHRPLIDGQQRLTTLQVLLAAALSVARDAKAEQAVGLLATLVRNDDILVEQEPDRFKVWPSAPDRATFEAVMSGVVPSSPDHQIARAAEFFRREIAAWAGQEDPTTRLQVLARTLRSNVELVVIDLQPGDNAQVIFESLNYGGRELTAIDLTKNHVFFRAAKKSLEPHALHDKYWAPFDDPWWRKEVSQGRLKRARAELFLMHWLKLEKLEEVRAHRLFVEFRDLPGLKADLESVVRRLAVDRDLYARAETTPGELPVETGGFFARLDVLDQSTPRPVGLQLLRAAPEVLSPARAARAFHALDSYMWRRALMRGSTANYNRLMLDLLKAIDGDLARADERVIAHLGALQGDTVMWPTDDALRNDLRVRLLYGRGRVAAGVVGTALRLVENLWRLPKGEGPLAHDAKLQIEHVLPQKWHDHWPVEAEPVGTLVDQETDREAHINRLGNLTLVSPTLNPSMSNSGWKTKREALREHSNVLITQRYLELGWDEAQIRARAEHLIDAMLAIWPGPDGAFTQPVPR